MSGPVACDYSFARPDLAVLKQAGYQGAIRYLAPLPNLKVITAGEAQAIWAAGLDLVLVWESYAQAASGGRPAGQREGTEALRQANALGWPANRPVYFVLEDPNRVDPSVWPAIEDYCRGLVDAGWPTARIGGYGSQALIEHVADAGFISWGWQVEGWSAGVSARCHLYQRNAPTVAPASVAGSIDEDAILASDYGAWRPDQPITPAAASPALPGPAPSPNPPSGPIGSPTPVPDQEGMMIQRWQTTTGTDGTAYIDLPIPAGCTMLAGGWPDVLDPTGFTPPHHDVDIHQAHDQPTTGPAGAVCAPCVGGQIPAGHARLRLTGAAAGHFYTGTALFV